MMYKKDKLILVDCDGVLVDWSYAFDCWMEKRGYVLSDTSNYDCAVRYGIPKAVVKDLISHFNESAAIGFLPPLRDAVKYVRKLHYEHGYIFHCITSLSKDPYAAKLREKNLAQLFGETVFDRIICLDCGADKDEVLIDYAGSECYWIEDKIENAMCGFEYGLDSLLIAHDHNSDNDIENYIPRVQNWKEIYEQIVYN